MHVPFDVGKAGLEKPPACFDSPSLDEGVLAMHIELTVVYPKVVVAMVTKF
jgi:hypothetical protein